LPSSLKVSRDWLIARTRSVKTLVEKKGARERASELFRTLVNLSNLELHLFFTVNISDLNITSRLHDVLQFIDRGSTSFEVGTE